MGDIVSFQKHLDGNQEKVNAKLNITKYLKDLFGDIFQNDKEIKTIKTERRDNGAFVYELKLLMYDVDHKLVLEVPAALRISPIENDKNHIKVELRLPDVNNLDNLELVRREEQFENSKKAVEKLCWDVFQSINYDPDKLIDKFGAVDEDVLLSSSENIIEHLMFTAQKDSSNKVKLSNVFASYSPTDALSDLDSLLDDETFVSTISTDETKLFVVENKDDSYNIYEGINSLDSIKSTAMGFHQLLSTLYTCLLDNKYFYYAAKGPDEELIISRTDAYCWWLDFIIDKLNTMIVEEGFEVVHPIEYMYDVTPGLTDEKDPWKAYVGCMIDDLEELCSALELYKHNFSEVHQEIIQDWIAKWIYELNSCSTLYNKA